MNRAKARQFLGRRPDDELVFALQPLSSFAKTLVAQWVAMADVACLGDERIHGARNDLRLFGGWPDACDRKSRNELVETILEGWDA